MASPRIACFATQGTGSLDEARIVSLLEDVEPEVLRFEHARQDSLRLRGHSATPAAPAGPGRHGRDRPRRWIGRDGRAASLGDSIRGVQRRRRRPVLGASESGPPCAGDALRACADGHELGVHRMVAVSRWAGAHPRGTTSDDGRELGAAGCRDGPRRSPRPTRDPLGCDRLRTGRIARAGTRRSATPTVSSSFEPSGAWTVPTFVS